MSIERFGDLPKLPYPCKACGNQASHYCERCSMKLCRKCQAQHGQFAHDANDRQPMNLNGDREYPQGNPDRPFKMKGVKTTMHNEGLSLAMFSHTVVTMSLARPGLTGTFDTIAAREIALDMVTVLAPTLKEAQNALDHTA